MANDYECIQCPYCQTKKKAYFITYPTGKFFKCHRINKCPLKGRSMTYEKFLYENDFEEYKKLVGNEYLTKNGERYQPRYSSETIAKKFIRDNSVDMKKKFSSD